MLRVKRDDPLDVGVKKRSNAFRLPDPCVGAGKRASSDTKPAPGELEICVSCPALSTTREAPAFTAAA